MLFTKEIMIRGSRRVTQPFDMLACGVLLGARIQCLNVEVDGPPICRAALQINRCKCRDGELQEAKDIVPYVSERS
jgi:hypothetical protein